MGYLGSSEVSGELGEEVIPTADHRVPNAEWRIPLRPRFIDGGERQEWIFIARLVHTLYTGSILKQVC